ncbi:hypothetical protein ACIQVR_41840 [Streptomyces xanthochromogenes]|uniref:hypothetical protein n=1 Tax=Streptomyces xanthochromogenes TaxID=67384 RepID=UPI0037FF21DE
MAVGALKARLLPPRILSALLKLDSAERELKRFRGPLLSVEDQGDRETLLARHAAADKILHSVPSMTASTTGGLS